MTISAGDTVTVDYTGRFEDGTVFDTTHRSVADESEQLDADGERTFEPLTVEVGAGELISGFEEALTGREEGDAFTVTIPPEAAYGEWDEERIRSFDREELDTLVGNREITPGSFLQTQQGTLQEVLEVDEEVVRVDFNHRLAGETLEFEIEIREVA